MSPKYHKKKSIVVFRTCMSKKDMVLMANAREEEQRTTKETYDRKALSITIVNT